MIKMASHLALNGQIPTAPRQIPYFSEVRFSLKDFFVARSKFGYHFNLTLTMSISEKLYRTATIGILIFATSCNLSDEELQDITPDRIRINNDSTALAVRMQSRNTVLDIINASGRVERDFELVLEKELVPPEIDGQSLQATTVTEESDKIFVSYNYAGAIFLGGVDYINPNLKLKAQVLFTDAEVHAVSADDDYVYAAGASGIDDVPAYIERIRLKGDGFSLEENSKASLGSYAANSVLVANESSDLFVTTGNSGENGGGIYKLDESLSTMAYAALHDARWVAEAGDYIYVAQGTPGNVTVYNQDLEEINAFPFEGANETEAKTTIDIADDRIFIAGGSEGVQVHELASGTYLYTINFEETNTVSNAVSAGDGLVFISNGLGVYVASYNQDDMNEEPQVLGMIQFDDELSANHVLYRSGRMYVASGLGGVKMIKVNK